MVVAIKTAESLNAGAHTVEDPFAGAKAQFLQQLECFMRARGGGGHLAGALTDGVNWYLTRFIPTLDGMEGRHVCEWTRLVVKTPAHCAQLVRMLVALTAAKAKLAAFRCTSHLPAVSSDCIAASDGCL